MEPMAGSLQLFLMEAVGGLEESLNGSTYLSGNSMTPKPVRAWAYVDRKTKEIVYVNSFYDKLASTEGYLAVEVLITPLKKRRKRK